MRAASNLATPLDAMAVPRKMRPPINPLPGALFFDVPDPRSDCDPLQGVHRHHHHGSPEKGPAQRLAARLPSAAAGTAAAGRAGLHLAFRAAREDLATPESWSSPISTRTAIEAMPEGCIAVVDAMGVTDAGIFRRHPVRAHGQAQGSRRSSPTAWCAISKGVLGTGLPVWCDGFAAPPSVAGLTFVGWGEPIGCGGVAIFPDDVIVAGPGWRGWSSPRRSSI